ncbi:MAG: hypothetical protein VXW65_03590 [Pseudomonadota bacterium]|nr:hypothetical protein [Pseudomonadota bacterium]
MMILWAVIGLICGLLIALPTSKVDTTCINLQTGLIINCVAAVVGGLFGVTWLAVLLLVVGSSMAIYALIFCKRRFSSELRL